MNFDLNQADDLFGLLCEKVNFSTHNIIEVDMNNPTIMCASTRSLIDPEPRNVNEFSATQDLREAAEHMFKANPSTEVIKDYYLFSHAGENTRPEEYIKVRIGEWGGKRTASVQMECPNQQAGGTLARTFEFCEDEMPESIDEYRALALNIMEWFHDVIISPTIPYDVAKSHMLSH